MKNSGFFILENPLMLEFLSQTCIWYNGGGIFVNFLPFDANVS